MGVIHDKFCHVKNLKVFPVNYFVALTVGCSSFNLRLRTCSLQSTAGRFIYHMTCNFAGSLSGASTTRGGPLAPVIP